MEPAEAQEGPSLLSDAERQRFEQLVLPHLDSAHNLARWLLRSESDAQDVAQEAMLRALRFFPGFHGGDPRAWLLKIVRNASYTAGEPPARGAVGGVRRRAAQ
jgi:RNA polymerase sigma-70 factor (ECF subfamily)